MVHVCTSPDAAILYGGIILKWWYTRSVRYNEVFRSIKTTLKDNYSVKLFALKR